MRAARAAVPLAPLTLEAKPRADGFSLSETGTFSKGGFSISSAGISARPLGTVTEPLPTMTYDQLEVLHTLGAGASSVVKVARHVPTNKRIALKVLNMMSDESTRKQAINELKVLHDCNCVHLCALLNAFYADGSLVIALPLARCSLADVFAAMSARTGASAAAAAAAAVQADWVAQAKQPLSLRLRGAAGLTAERALAAEAARRAAPAPPSALRVPERALAALLTQALRGLAYLHSERHQVHRDLKPANMLISTNGVLTLSDFGISKTLEDTRAMASSFVGTALYMAPERICGEDYSYAADVWSVGVVGWEGAHGAHPFAHLRSYYDLVEELSLPSDLPLAVDARALPARAADFVAQCVRKRSTARLTAQALLQHPLIAQLAPAADAQPLDDEADALRLGAIVSDWLAAAQLDVEAALPRAAESPPFVRRRELSAHMSELERQLANL